MAFTFDLFDLANLGIIYLILSTERLNFNLFCLTVAGCKETLKLLQLYPDFLATMLFHTTKYTKFWSAAQYSLKVLLLSKHIYAYSHLK